MLRDRTLRTTSWLGIALGVSLGATLASANRESSSTSGASGAGNGALAQAGGSAAAPPDTRIKIIPKPVPCVPCPCECPEVRGPTQSPLATLQGPGETGGPQTNPAEGPRGLEPAEGQERPGRTGRGDEPRGRKPGQVTPPAIPSPPPAPRIGTITGEVVVRDRGGKEKSDRGDVVVYIEKIAQRKFAALKRTRKMAQRDKSFTPHVLAVTKGSVVEFPNEDKLFHNVFSLSDGNTFDLGLYRQGTSKNVTFDKTGVVDVYCNIHPNMWGQILVLDNPFYAVTSKEGGFEIPKVPAGNYTLVAWLSGGDPVRKQVRIEPGEKADVKFELREGSTSKPHLNKFNQPYGRYK